jgi:hypothetical protein
MLLNLAFYAAIIPILSAFYKTNLNFLISAARHKAVTASILISATCPALAIDGGFVRSR